MSVARIYYVKHARQRFEKDRSNVTTIEVKRKDGTPKMGRGGRPMVRRIAARSTTPLPNYHCSRCQVEIKPGDPYLYWEPGFRSNYKVVRCMKTTCSPRPSERESSLVQEILAAQESVEDQINGLSAGDADESTFEALRDEVSEAFENVIQQYNDADEAMGGSQATQAYERAEELEGQKDEIDSVDFDPKPTAEDIDESCDAHEEFNDECDDCNALLEEKVEQWFDDAKSALEDALSQIG